MSDIDYLKKYLPKDILSEGISKLQQGIPVQYIVGNVDFYGYNIKVNENVLIPRFETETLIEYTLKYIKERFHNNKIDIIDLGTGSGAIAITLAKKLNASVIASDISKEALEVAKDNAILNNVKIDFRLSNMLDNINEKVDVIISNPPYIGYDEDIMDIVKNNEPHIALYADNNGLYYYDYILKNCQKNLKENFIIAFEIGYKQAYDITNMAYKYLDNIEVITKKDYSEKDRFIFIFSK